MVHILLRLFITYSLLHIKHTLLLERRILYHIFIRLFLSSWHSTGTSSFCNPPCIHSPYLSYPSPCFNSHTYPMFILQQFYLIPYLFTSSASLSSPVCLSVSMFHITYNSCTHTQHLTSPQPPSQRLFPYVSIIVHLRTTHTPHHLPILSTQFPVSTCIPPTPTTQYTLSHTSETLSSVKNA